MSQSAVTASALKWSATMRVAWTNQLAYKLNFLILVIGPVFVFFFIKYNLWSSIYAMEGVSTIQGYDLNAMLEYQIWVMIVAFLAHSYNNMKLSEDIRLGRISSYLIYPFGFWQFHTATFFGTQVIQIVVSALTVATVVLAGFSLHLAWPDTFFTLLFCAFVGLLWFSIAFILGLASFWMEETWILRVIFTILANFLSGAIIPLEMYPAWFRAVLDWTPFPLMTFVPVKMFMGEYAGSYPQAFLMIAVWLAVLASLAALTWKKGLKMYTGAGM
jgi:ABC-2 type transport system permease protein